MTTPPAPPTAPDRGARRRVAATVGLAALVLGTVAAVDAGAAPPPHAKANGRGSDTTTTTTTAPSTTTDTADSSSSEAFEPVALQRAALRLVIQTTSGYVQVDLPGVSAGHVVVEARGRDAAAVQPT